MDYFDSILKKTRHRKAVMKRVIAVLSVVVLLFTINTTKKTADTLERISACGIGEQCTPTPVLTWMEIWSAAL